MTTDNDLSKRLEEATKKVRHLQDTVVVDCINNGRAPSQQENEELDKANKELEALITESLLADGKLPESGEQIESPVIDLVVAQSELIVETQEEDIYIPATGPTKIVDSVAIGEAVNIRDVAVPIEMQNNVSMGHAKLDTLMSGDGATPSMACLVTGVPGSGKTTMLMQLADCITRTGNIAIYNSCEESMVQVSRVAKRLRLNHGFMMSSHRTVFDIIAHADLIRLKNPGKQVFLFVDSLQTIEVPHYEYDENYHTILGPDNKPKMKRGRPSGPSSAAVEATFLLTQWCKKTYSIMFLIGQVNKDGDFAGRQAIKHWVDAHLHLDINKERRSADYGSRIAEMTKNRFGIAGIFYPFEIEARGIKFTEPKKTP